MKKRTFHFFDVRAIFFASALVLFTACNQEVDPEPTLQDLAFEKLAGQWTLGQNGAIVLDGQDISLNYPGFTLSFTDGTYTTTNAGDLVSASGTWRWTNDQANQITLEDSRIVTIALLTETRFTFSFTFDGQGGIASGLGGSYSISLEK